ncbi:MAG: ABC transporter ATP-binding protein, partial [bacterium]
GPGTRGGNSVMTQLRAEGIRVTFYPHLPDRTFQAVCNADVQISQGEILGMVGESGCGKSLTALSMLNLQPNTARAEGTIEYGGRDYEAGGDELSGLRGTKIGMIFQEPMTALNPVYSVGWQLAEALYFTKGIEDKQQQRRRSIELLETVQLDRAEDRLDSYPHQLSGGQRQRVMIALALAGEPDYLVADEPTTALDATLEKGIMDLFQELARDRGLGVLLITHDLALVGRVSDRITVMYSGYTVENGPSETIMESPQHPYTQGLVASSTAIQSNTDRLPVIPGDVPDPEERPEGCPFHPRCEEKEPRCETDYPETFRPIERVTTDCWAREDSEYAAKEQDV